MVEEHLKASGLRHSILRPTAFFENYDDAANYNPLKRGSLKFLTMDPCFLVSTFDVGKAAAAMLSDTDKWNTKTLTCTSWKGSLKEAAAALEAVSGTKTVGSLAMPKFARSCFLSDLDAMCVFFEVRTTGGPLFPRPRVLTISLRACGRPTGRLPWHPVLH
jgi:uncharacterized protein YbjT (DUF2867 family)